jgi:hypothetical protein
MYRFSFGRSARPGKNIAAIWSREIRTRNYTHAKGSALCAAFLKAITKLLVLTLYSQLLSTMMVYVRSGFQRTKRNGTEITQARETRI